MFRFAPAPAAAACALALAIAFTTACATTPPRPWVEPGGAEERARLTLDVSLTLKHGDTEVRTVSMPQATALLQGRVARERKTPEVQLAIIDVKVPRPESAAHEWTTYPPQVADAPSKPKRTLGEDIDESDALFLYERWADALLIPGLVAIGNLPPPPEPGSCTQVVLTELGREEGAAADDLFELELTLALLSGTLSPPGSGLDPEAPAAPEDQVSAVGRCDWRVSGQEGEVATVTTLAARLTSAGPGQVDALGVLKTLTSASYAADKSVVESTTMLRPGKLFPADGRLTVRSEHPLPPKIVGGRRASYLYEFTVRLKAL